MLEQSQGKILIVDDDDVLREFYVRVFSNFGYRTVCAEDGEQAVSLLRSSSDEYDLVILDMLLPVKSGWDVLEFMRTTPETAGKPVISITGMAADNQELERLNELCDEVILKGKFEMSRLSAAAGRLLGVDLGA